MRAVVAGAGTLGRKISSYLLNAGYEVIFIDYNIEAIRDVTTNEGLAGIYGQSTSLEVMKNVDVGNANIFIAVTSIDEINILGCEVADFFGTPRKIARINNRSYLTDDWINHMYSSDRVAINSIIAINIILAKSIVKTLTLNNTCIDKIYDFFDGKLKIVSLFALEHLRFINCSINDFYKTFFNFNLSVITINRNNSFIDISNKKTVIQKDDVIYLLIESNQLAEFLEIINTKDEIEKYYDYNYITLLGDHDGIYYLAEQLMKDPKVRLNIITTNKNKAQDIAQAFQQTSKDRLNIILTESFEKSIKSLYPRYNENFIIMNDIDKENILLSLYCKYSNLENVSCILQDSEYESLLNYIGIKNIYVIDQYMLIPVIDEIKGPYENKVALIKSNFKLVELYVAPKSIFIGKKLSEINIKHNGIKAIAALSCGTNDKEELYIKDTDLLLQEGDRILFTVQYNYIKQADELFNQFVS